jgi:drug/metabolite transporter (DMT)-like permease
MRLRNINLVWLAALTIIGFITLVLATSLKDRAGIDERWLAWIGVGLIAVGVGSIPIVFIADWLWFRNEQKNPGSRK